MSLGKRHIGRRVAGVGVAVALMVIGLEAPAFAAAPVVSSFTPTSGPATGGCVVVVTGTGLDDFPAAANYTFFFVLTSNAATTVQATDYLIISDTEAWVTTPALAPGNSYFLKATNPGGTSTGTTQFLATNGAGGCAPTITSFAPACGLHGSATVITGTNLLRETAVPATKFEGDIGGGIVSFSPYTSDASHTVPDVDESTSLSVLVSSDAADGPIKVTTKGTTAAPLDGMSVFSTARFEVPPPDCIAVVEGHPRAITFKLKKSGKASGVVSSTEDPAFTDCVSAVPVKIQKKKKGGGWKTKANATTSDTGSYSAKIKGKPGKYRALAPKIAGTTAADDCLKAKSATRKI
jgi:IPT/TIG domain